MNSTKRTFNPIQSSRFRYSQLEDSCLDKFMMTDFYHAIKFDERERLMEQAWAMKSYPDILGNRKQVRYGTSRR